MQVNRSANKNLKLLLKAHRAGFSSDSTIMQAGGGVSGRFQLNNFARVG